MFENLNILYVEDEDFIRQNTLEVFEVMSIKVTAASNGEEAYEIYKKLRPNVVITDIEMPKMSGLELAEKIRKIDSKTQIIITTAYTNTEYFLKAVELNLLKYLLKPVSLIDINDVLKKCLSKIETVSNIKYFNETDYFDFTENKLVVNNSVVRLDYKENRLFELLLKHANHTVTYLEIENIVWDDEVMTSLALRTLVNSLRQKLPKDVIKNISKTGYLIKIVK